MPRPYRKVITKCIPFLWGVEHVEFYIQTGWLVSQTSVTTVRAFQQHVELQALVLAAKRFNPETTEKTCTAP